MKAIFTRIKKGLWPLLSIFVFLFIWEVGARILHEDLLLPSPMAVLQTLALQLREPLFYKNLQATFFRGLGGFSLAFIWGLSLGILASLRKPFRYLLQPFLVLARSVPLLALILLALLWFHQGRIPYFIVFLIAFPIITDGVLKGAESVDPQLLEMARSFGLSRWEILRHVTIPHLSPYLLTGISTGLGIAWKAVIAAEIITMPAYAIGTAMQRAQLELDSQSLFCWTLVIMLLSGICDWILHRSFAFFPRRKSHA